MLNKSFLTNFITVIIVVIGYILAEPHTFAIGCYALSGALTNWIAIYMLFEKVPGLYGSGVIPSRFEEFKQGIKSLIMDQFFTPDNISNFFASQSAENNQLINNITEAIDYDLIFDKLIEAIMASSFAGMLGMLGGAEALEKLRPDVISKLDEAVTEIINSGKFKQSIKSDFATDTIISRVEAIVDQRLNELTPKMVKDIIQTMIRQHLGWLVVWGGVFGGLIGLVVSFFS